MKLNNKGYISIESVLIAGIILMLMTVGFASFNTNNKYNSISHNKMSVYEIMITN